MKENIRVIGLIGRAGTGKTHIAKQLHKTLEDMHPQQDIVTISFSTPLKRMLSTLFDEQDKTLPVYKEKTLRYFLQTLGTEWGRNIIDKDFWIDMSLRKTYEQMKSGFIIVDDVRFKNEAKAIYEYGGQVFYLKRDKLEDIKESNHISETEMETLMDDAISVQNEIGGEDKVVQNILNCLPN